MSPEPFNSGAKALPAKRSEKGYGDENDQCIVLVLSLCHSFARMISVIK